VAVGYGVWWHVTADTWMLSGPSDSFWSPVAYFGPAVAGLFLIFFMVKPILARPAKRKDPVAISADEEPVLFAFVNDVCRQVGAPSPDRIQVDCGVNASAGFASAPLGLQQPQLVLTIGLPLAGLTVRQFGGVLAHEFGHFAQTSGMRLTFIVRSINNWFARVVHERDEWDEKLQTWTAEGRHGAVVSTMMLAQLFVWGSRLVLYLLMMAGHAISCFMLRQMEYDADSCEIRLIGSRAFASTFERLQELTIGAQRGYRDVRIAWARRTLPANLPAFFLECTARMRRESLQPTAAGATDERTGMFDTHPCNADRIRAADRAAEPGILEGGEDLAFRLFTSFDAIGAAATRHHYEQNLQLPVSEATLMDTASAVAAIERQNENERAASRFFHDGLSLLRPVRVAMLPEDAAAGPVPDWGQARASMETMRATISQQYRRYESLQQSRDLATMALAFIESGYSKLVPQHFELTEATSADAQSTLARAVAQLKELEPDLARFESAVATRLACILRANATRDLRAEAEPLVQPLAALADIWPELVELHHVTRVLLVVAPATAACNENPQARLATLGRLEARLGKHWRSIRTRLENVPAGGDSALALTDTLGLDTDTCADPKRAAVLLDRALTMRTDLICRLAALAVQAEQIADAAAQA
jgi:Zn-dependent protease with chaperone function